MFNRKVFLSTVFISSLCLASHVNVYAFSISNAFSNFKDGFESVNRFSELTGNNEINGIFKISESKNTESNSAPVVKNPEINGTIKSNSNEKERESLKADLDDLKKSVKRMETLNTLNSISSGLSSVNSVLSYFNRKQAVNFFYKDLSMKFIGDLLKFTERREDYSKNIALTSFSDTKYGCSGKILFGHKEDDLNVSFGLFMKGDLKVLSGREYDESLLGFKFYFNNDFLKGNLIAGLNMFYDPKAKNNPVEDVGFAYIMGGSSGLFKDITIADNNIISPHGNIGLYSIIGSEYNFLSNINVGVDYNGTFELNPNVNIHPMAKFDVFKNNLFYVDGSISVAISLGCKLSFSEISVGFELPYYFDDSKLGFIFEFSV